MLTGSISVTVAKRLANGNLLVRGQKWITINQGREYVRISGHRAPGRHRPDNSVPSTQVADAVIAYGGQGTLADCQHQGLAGALLRFQVDAVLGGYAYESMQLIPLVPTVRRHGDHVGTARRRVSHAERVKDIASVSGVRTNQLVGYGLVVGLNGTGDQTTQAPFTIQSIANMLAKFGVTIPSSVDPQMQLKNVAAVTVTADLPPFAKPGQTIDVTVASIGNATSLRGGALLMTPLRGADGEVYAMAQGSVRGQRLRRRGKDGSRVSVNIPSGGRIPNGATVEREVPNDFAQPAVRDAESQHTRLHHRRAPDRRHQQDCSARAARRRSMRCRSRCRRRPTQTSASPSIGTLQELRDRARRGAGARDHQFAHRHRGHQLARAGDAGRGGAWLAVGHHHRSAPTSASPTAFSQGTHRRSRRAREINRRSRADARMFVFHAGVNLDEIVRAVNQVGAAPGDLVAILEALQQAGALRAQLVVI